MKLNVKQREKGWRGGAPVCVFVDAAGGGGCDRIGLVCGTTGRTMGAAGGGVSVTRFCFVAQSTGVCRGCRLASPCLLSNSGGRTSSHENRGPGAL